MWERRGAYQGAGIGREHEAGDANPVEAGSRERAGDGGGRLERTETRPGRCAMDVERALPAQNHRRNLGRDGSTHRQATPEHEAKSTPDIGRRHVGVLRTGIAATFRGLGAGLRLIAMKPVKRARDGEREEEAGNGGSAGAVRTDVKEVWFAGCHSGTSPLSFPLPSPLSNPNLFHPTLKRHRRRRSPQHSTLLPLKHNSQMDDQGDTYG